MYILLAFVAACALGIGLHYMIPHREMRGVAITPAITTATAGILYTALQWAGLPATSVWLWVISIGGALAIGAVGTVILVRTRIQQDAERAVKAGLTPGQQN